MFPRQAATSTNLYCERRRPRQAWIDRLTVTPSVRCHFFVFPAFGGLGGNRTPVQGFAVLCVATPPRGHPTARFRDRRQRYTNKGCPAATHIGQYREIRQKDAGCRLMRQRTVAYLVMRAICPRVIPGSSAVEQSTVNRLVAGSNPAPGATNLFLGLFARLHKSVSGK